MPIAIKWRPFLTYNNMQFDFGKITEKIDAFKKALVGYNQYAMCGNVAYQMGGCSNSCSGTCSGSCEQSCKGHCSARCGGCTSAFTM